MKVKCKYCDAKIDDTLEKCPQCGAANENLKRAGSGEPKTIEELKEWYKDKNLPPEDVTRFFIGKDIKEAKAFGIYKDPGSNKYVVYKNKANGQRAVRYEGTDEAYAVNELYLRLREEIVNQKNNQKTTLSIMNKLYVFAILFIPLVIIALTRIYGGFFRGYAFVGAIFAYFGLIPLIIIIIELFIRLIKKEKSLTTGSKLGLFLFIVIFLGAGFGIGSINRNCGYYNINGNTYYYIEHDWYIYDNGWTTSEEPNYDGNLSDYYSGYYYDDDFGGTDFKDSDYWDDYDSSGSGDSGSSWDSGDSWDSGGTDWDSDW